MSKAKKKSSLYDAINSTFPTDVAERYDEIVRAENLNEDAIVGQLGRGRPYFQARQFVPPRAYQFRVEFRDEQGRGYQSFAEQPDWLAIKLPKRDLSRFDPLSFPEPNEVVVTDRGSFQVVDLVLAKTRSTTAMLQVKWS